MNKLRIWWADTRGKVIVMLLVLWIATLINSFQIVYLIFPLVSTLFVYVFDLLVSRIRTGQWIATLSSLVTGLLIGLVFDPTAPIYVLIFACLVAVVSKQLFAAGNHQHIWNPTVFGVAVTSLIFNQSTGWWAASWGLAPVIIILVGMTLALRQIRRLVMPFVFLAIVYVYLGLTTTWIGALQLIITGTYIFFAFIMLPEPVTSVGGKIWTYAWPALVGGLVVLLSVFRIFIADPVFLALLIANTLIFIFVRRPRMMQRQQVGVS